MTQAGHDQADFRLRFEWGSAGAERVPADHAVVVDVLSFTTCVTVAAERGITVLPYRWRDVHAARFAADHDAVLAVGRSEARHDAAAVSLSPVSIRDAEGVTRLVLPSPNGSTIAALLADRGTTVHAASVRNAAAVGRRVAEHLARGESVTVIAAGERWPDDGLRPAVEDLWGAGAVISAARARVDIATSPEAEAAAAAWAAVHRDVPAALSACASGVELIEYGFRDDVALAAQVDATDVVPVLVGDEFVS